MRQHKDFLAQVDAVDAQWDIELARVRGEYEADQLKPKK